MTKLSNKYVVGKFISCKKLFAGNEFPDYVFVTIKAYFCRQLSLSN